MPQRTHLVSFEACTEYVDHCLEYPDAVRCLVVSDAKEVRAICLLEPRTEHRLGFRIPVWGVLWLSRQSIYADVVCPEDDLRRVLAPLLAGHLRRHPEGRRFLALGPLESDAILWESLGRLASPDLCREPTERIRILDCRQPFDKLEAGASKNFRHSLKAARKRLAALPDVRFQVVRGPRSVADELPALLEMESSGWKGKAGTAIRDRRGLADYYRGLAGRLDGERDYCEILSLSTGGRCIASSFITLTGTSCAAMKIAFDENYSSISPGQLLATRVIGRCCTDPGIERIHFLSEAAWLRGWPSVLVDLQVVFVNIGGPLGRLLLTLLRFRLGPLRRLVRRLQSRLRRTGAHLDEEKGP